MAKAARSPEREPDPDFSEETSQITDPPQDQHVDQTPADAAVEERRITERRARAQGWVPQDQYRGDSAKWVDAETFLEKGYGNNDILRESVNRLADKVSERDQRIEELTTRVAESGQVLQSINNKLINADRDAYARGIADAEARMRKAAGEADTEAYDEAKADLDALEAKPVPVERPAQQPARTQQPAPKAPTIDPVTEAWVNEPAHSWFKDPKLSRSAVTLHKSILEDNPGMSLRASLDAVDVEIRQLFPEQFENPRRNARGSVGSPSGDRGGNGRGNGNGRSFANLPEDAKREFTKTRNAMGPDKKTGKPYFTEQMFLDQYNGEFVR